MKLQPGDIILCRQVQGSGKVVSDLIAWWLHSNWSHVVPVYDSESILDIVWPHSCLTDIQIRLNRRYKYKILRPTFLLTVDEKVNWQRAIFGLIHKDYDLKSVIGFIENSVSVQDPNKMNCAEGTLCCFKAIGKLLDCNNVLISPQSFDDFALAGFFTTIEESK